MSLSELAEAIGESDHDMLSTDLFDTVLLRDHSIESERLAIACRRAALRLGVEAAVLTRLRWSFHDNAYRAVAMERPEGEASLAAVCRAISASLGLGADAARLFHQTEVDVDIEHLSPNRPLVAQLRRAALAGMRVIAVSDTYYATADLQRILETVVGPDHPITAVYSSADIGLTKHAGRVFDEVARRENVPAARILHVGDSYEADVRMARAAAWTAVHLPRDGRHRVAKIAGKVLALPIRLRRAA
jgi:FMN phosphatase YigB (HAD superfamily)